jgi:hypothetical protein
MSEAFDGTSRPSYPSAPSAATARRAHMARPKAASQPRRRGWQLNVATYVRDVARFVRTDPAINAYLRPNAEPMVDHRHLTKCELLTVRMCFAGMHIRTVVTETLWSIAGLAR